MRGHDEQTTHMFSYLSPKARRCVLAVRYHSEIGNPG